MTMQVEICTITADLPYGCNAMVFAIKIVFCEGCRCWAQTTILYRGDYDGEANDLGGLLTGGIVTGRAFDPTPERSDL